MPKLLLQILLGVGVIMTVAGLGVYFPAMDQWLYKEITVSAVISAVGILLVIGSVKMLWSDPRK